MARSKYQTLSQFILAPFNNTDSLDRDTKYSTMYQKYRGSNRIRIASTTEIEGAYYYHIKIPSESQEGNEYDVVIRFFTDKPHIKLESHLRNYYIQFFSNSPSFIYQYAYVYNQRGYLIEDLYKKMDTDYINTPPTKTNTDLKLDYDKSIYFACRFLASERFKLLGKSGGMIFYKKSPDKFFNGIQDFQSKKIEQDIINEERKLKNELGSIEQRKAKQDIGKLKREKLHPTEKLTGGIKKIKAGGRKGKIGAKKRTSGIHFS